MVIWVDSPTAVRFSLLIPRMLTFTLAISCLNTSNLPWIHGSNIPGSYAILLFTASDVASITSHIHNWVLFLLWLHPFILSGLISPLISSSILDTYRPGEFIFQRPIFLPFHTVHGVLIHIQMLLFKWQLTFLSINYVIFLYNLQNTVRIHSCFPFHEFSQLLFHTVATQRFC